MEKAKQYAVTHTRLLSHGNEENEVGPPFLSLPSCYVRSSQSEKSEPYWRRQIEKEPRKEEEKMMENSKDYVEVCYDNQRKKQKDKSISFLGGKRFVCLLIYI